jgi:hypothetical protein
MRTKALVLAASAAALLTFVATLPAHALGPLDLEIAGKLGYGSDHYDFGFGGRAGISFLGLYGGFNVVDYLGGGTDHPHILTYGGEVGFGFKISFVTIRPLVGFGDEIASGCGAVGCSSGGSFYVQPGGLLQFTFGHLIFGVDAGALIPTTSGYPQAFTLNGEIGVRF